MAFANSSNFVIQTFNATDGRASGEDVFQRLVNEACLGAGHRSNERYDAPKCHPETRKAVIDDILSWVNNEGSEERILWMSGPAGAGKSSIAQTVCEICYEEGKLLSAFFFSRTATGTGRDDGNRLVPTIACQLAATITETKHFIVNELESDVALLSYSMGVQMEKLVLKPISQARADTSQLNPNNAIPNDVVENAKPFPYLVVIDGLDECNDPQMQSTIIRTIAASFSDIGIASLRFLVASRPELEIRSAFNSTAVSKLCARIVLNERYKPDEDILVYLRSEFASLKREHTLKAVLLEDSHWPTSSILHDLVHRSSGQFIYASTVMKYLKHPRRDPREALQYIIESSSNSGVLFKQSPFTQLDQLYLQVLNAAASNFQSQKDSIIIIFQLLLFGRDTEGYNLRSISTAASFISMNQTKLELLLTDLHSIMFVPYNYNSNDSLRFYHASFGDFLQNPSRSGEFYINKKEAHKVLAYRCFKKLSEYQRDNRLTDAVGYSFRSCLSHVQESGFNDALLKEICRTPVLQTILHLLMEIPISSDSAHADRLEQVTNEQHFNGLEHEQRIKPDSSKLFHIGVNHILAWSIGVVTGIAVWNMVFHRGRQ